MDRRKFLRCLGSGAVAVGASECARVPWAYAADSARLAAAGAQGRPNVLFIAVDDLRPELGCYGNAVIQSPNIDRLAARGLVFRHAYCQQAVCSPSRSSLLTGTRPDTTQVWDLETHFRTALPDVVTLPQLFKNEGYFVQGMGKIYHGGLDDPASWSTPWTAPGVKTPADARALEPDEMERRARQARAKRRKGDRGVPFQAVDGPDNSLNDGVLADMAVAALQGLCEKEQPFFLAVGFVKPHLPFISPKKYWDLYDPEKIPPAPNPFLPKGAPPYALAERNELWSYDGVPDTSLLPDDYARQLKHGYYAAVSFMDAQVGRVLDELERLGLQDDTIVVLWGDHGWKLGEHGCWCKHSNVENDTNAPVILSVPGMAHAGSSTDALVEFVDIYPTLADLAGLPKPAHLEGASAAPLLAEPDREWKRAAFSQYPRTHEKKRLMGYSMRTRRYRFTRWVDRDDSARVEAVELYDHETDPQENVNIAGDPKNAALVEELTRQLVAGWRGALPS